MTPTPGWNRERCVDQPDHAAQTTNVSNSLNEYIVEVDGRRLGRLRSGASAQHEVSPGPHEVRVRLDTIMDPKMGYVGSPSSEADLRGVNAWSWTSRLCRTPPIRFLASGR